MSMITDAECAEVAQMRRNGMTLSEIADAVGMSRRGVTYRLDVARMRGFEFPQSVRRMRSRCPSDSDLLMLIRRGVKPQEIADRAGVSRATVYYWVNRARGARRMR